MKAFFPTGARCTAAAAHAIKKQCRTDSPKIEDRVGAQTKRLSQQESKNGTNLGNGIILRAIELGVSNARVEAVNNKIKVAIRQGYGFRNIDNLIALVMLRCSDLRPALPGRAAA